SLSRSRPHETLGQLALSSTPSASGSRRRWLDATSSTSSSARLISTGAVRRILARRLAAYWAPRLGSPIAFTIDSDFARRTIRGLGFPDRGLRVTVPATR